MKFVGLLSGGKDSLFAVGKAIAMGHQAICTANLYSAEEADSFMFQTVCTEFLPAIADCLGLPLVQRRLRGASNCKTLSYSVTEKDEVEDLYELLLEAKFQFPELQAVVSGAVFSDYQRIRVENVCSRLGLSSISPLWRKDQKELLQDMKKEGYEAVVVKISSMGLQEKHLGQSVTGLVEYFESLQKKFGFNVAGEGGEYETLILDAPIFRKRVFIEESENVVTGQSVYSPCAYLKVKKLSLIDKISSEKQDYSIENPKKPKLLKRYAEVFSSEVTAKSLGYAVNNFEHEVFVVLKGIKELLEDSGLDLTCIYYLTAYVKTMESFQKFNGVYSKFFSFPNPPSRVCVELADQDCGLKIAFKGTLNKKKCTHVQSISSWAPASIGPYSQSYLINNSLHLAGSIPLVPESMTLAKAEDSVDQCVNNCAAVARINDFSLESSDVCLVYYTSEKPVVRQDFFPFYIKVTSLPRGAPVELEMHLEKNLPASVNETFQHRTTEWSGRLLKKHCIDLVNLTWFVEIDEVSHLEGLLNSLESELQDYFNSVKHKSSVTKGQLLGSEDIQLSFKDYLNEIRIYDPCPDKFKGFKTWIDEGPTIFLHSSTSAIFIKLQDFLQINTYQFINSGN